MADDSLDDWDTDSLRRYSQQLVAYLEAQGDTVAALRNRSQPHPPWPEVDNPMLGYLISRAIEAEASDGARTAIAWLAVHAWFEGALHERAEVLRSLSS